MDARKKRRLRILGKILFVLYILFVFYFLIFSDWYGRTGEMQEYHYNLVLFKEIKRFWNYRGQLGAFATFTNLFGNIVIFLPFGFFMPMASKYRSFWATAVNSLALSLLVETFQLLTRVGCFDVDDLVLNTLGGILGYITFMICNTIRRRYNAKRKGNKYGQAKLKHSKKGIQSCVIAGIVLVALAAMIVTAYISAGTAAPYIGGLALVTLILTVAGGVLAVRGLKEREKNYLTCKIGIGCNIFFIIAFIAIFCRGLF